MQIKYVSTFECFQFPCFLSSNRRQLALIRHTDPHITSMRLIVLLLNIDIVKNAMQCVHLGLGPLRSVMVQHLVSLALDELLVPRRDDRGCVADRLLERSTARGEGLGGHGGGGQVVGREVGLQLLEEDEDEGDLVFLFEVLEFGFLKFVQIEMHILISIQNIWCLVEEVIQELGQEHCCSFILLLRDLHLLLNIQIVLLQILVLMLCLTKFLLNFLQFVFQEINQIVILLRVWEFLAAHEALTWTVTPDTSCACTATDWWSCKVLSLSIVSSSFATRHLQILNLHFEFLDNLLAKVRSFCKLLLNFLVNFYFNVEFINLGFHIVVLEQQLLGLF